MLSGKQRTSGNFRDDLIFALSGNFTSQIHPPQNTCLQYAEMISVIAIRNFLFAKMTDPTEKKLNTLSANFETR